MVVLAHLAVICAAAVLVEGHAIQLAEMVEPGLSPRAAFYGGFALSATTCPAGTTSCGDSTQHSCCSNDQNCFTYAYEAFCCPDKSNCRSQVEALPVCADPSWTLFKSSLDYFCCQSGQVGVTASGAGVCAGSDVSVPQSKLASTALFDVSHLRPDESQITQVGGATDAPSPGAGSATAKFTAKTTSRATGSAPTGTSVSGDSSSGSSSSGSSSSSSSTKLSTGAVISIAICAAIAIGLIILFSWVCYRRGQRRAMQRQPPRQQPVYISEPVPAYSPAPPSQPAIEYKSPVVTPQAPMMPEQGYGHNPHATEIDSRTGTGGRVELGM
ncbi:hypothetical protein GP486_002511 [Trichoglossum hirsutum]|uniref:Transmembrane protein n=1 Tax=Trichoglossum hirsutum TaxID=265104 RepID=A0A9P8RRN2_9PEZI|nr:hypothetical protein GP486_002511 [Trichoglossum hirsutum]